VRPNRPLNLTNLASCVIIVRVAPRVKAKVQTESGRKSKSRSG